MKIGFYKKRLSKRFNGLALSSNSIFIFVKSDFVYQILDSLQKPLAVVIV